MPMQVTVLRDGKTREISSSHLVVGDVLLFNTGDILPVDGILIRGSDIKCGPPLPTLRLQVPESKARRIIKGRVRNSASQGGSTKERKEVGGLDRE